MGTFKAVLFDLGNVVIQLDEQRTYREFGALGEISEAEAVSRFLSSPIFHDFERGNITEQAFMDGLRQLLGKPQLSDEKIQWAWNTILEYIDPDLIQAIKQMKAQYHLMVLSNTNSIHEKAFHQMLFAISGFQHLDQLFHDVYLSHQIRERKPDLASWQFILNRHDFRPAEILFLDDKPENLAGADSLGIRTQLINHPGETMELIRKII